MGINVQIIDLLVIFILTRGDGSISVERLKSRGCVLVIMLELFTRKELFEVLPAPFDS